MLALFPITATANPETMDNPLEPLRWENRVILYTLAEEDRKAFAEAVAEHRAGLGERHLVLIGDAAALPDKGPDGGISGAEREWLREHYAMDAGVTELLLIGKDGGVKERIDRVDFPFLFAAIDRMPMRRAEMRRQREE